MPPEILLGGGKVLDLAAGDPDVLRKVVEEAEGLVPGDIEGLRAAMLLDEGLPLVKGALDELIRVAAVGQERVSVLWSVKTVIMGK